MKSRLEIQRLTTGDPVKFRVYATNGKFTAETECYLGLESLRDLATSLSSFPTKVGQSLEFGKPLDSSFVKLSFVFHSISSGCFVRVQLGEIERYRTQPEVRDICNIAEFEVACEPQQIAQFGKSIQGIADTQGSVDLAILGGNET